MGYGAKLANLYVGVLMINSFADATLSTKVIDSNTKNLQSSTNYGGLKTSLKPSAVLDMGQLKVYGTLNLDLNATKYHVFFNHKTNELIITPNLLESVGFSALAAYQLNDKTTIGLTLGASMNDSGNNLKFKTNTGTLSIETNYVDSSFKISTVLGASIAANDTVTLFFDLPLGMQVNPTAYWKGGSQLDAKTTNTYTLPTPKMGAQIGIIKNVKFRISATPTWTRTVTQPADYAKISTPTGTKTITDAYSLSTSLGLGVKLGQFYINGIVGDTLFTKTIQNPISLLAGIFTGAATSIVSSFQVNYVF